jgi:DNA-binding MarR family transcriptional regulator/DNA-binding Lrp family transcriptional regulator
MPLKIQAVLDRLTGCEPEARFILEAIARDSSLGRCEGEYIRSKLLAKQLHMAEGAVTAALGELVAAGLVERIESASAGKGRPKVSYQVAPQSLALLAGQQCSHALHSEHMQRLFSEADIPAEILGAQPKPRKERAIVTKHGKPAPPGARSRLSICNRLLLGALLANADQFGVVVGLSNLELRQLTGLDSESLSHRLQRLRGLGLIRSYVPGVTSSIFRTKKVNSTYFLNLNHPGYGLCEVGAVLVHWLPQSKVRNDTFDVLWRDVLGFRSSLPPLNRPETPKTILHFLARERRPVFDVLRLMLYRCASELLSRHWDDLARDGEGHYDWLHDRIEAYLQPPAGYGGADVEPDRAWQEILSYFCKLVVEIGQAYRARFGVANWIGFDLVQLCILPVLQSEGDEVIALLLQPRPTEASICTILREYPRGDVIPENWGAETEVPLDYRLYCGLLTPPAPRLLKR